MKLSKAERLTVTAIGESVHRYAKELSEAEWTKGYLMAMEMALQIVRASENHEHAIASLDSQVVGMRAISKTKRITEPEAHKSEEQNDER